ncbi:hypothetical protein [uncultured Brevundimonas sp.]|uniref:hypothetical protein n=1 Tax=uncultured Brevundimonas sp. TaxID=213418 RepID=UPI0026219038|nr:hypothetical protein [uncultured Brevundimonas sp.]
MVPDFKPFIVARRVSVAVDESKFTEEFLSEYRKDFYPFQTIDDHREHLAILYARGVLTGWRDEFIEGYGPASEMGITFMDDGSEVVEQAA